MIVKYHDKKINRLTVLTNLGAVEKVKKLKNSIFIFVPKDADL